MFFKLKILILRILGYDKPLRVAFLKYLSLKFKKFRPHYETILLESTIEAKKLGYKEVSILELGVAGGNGIISLENYKKKIEKVTGVKINIFGFDYGEGLPTSNNKFDSPYFWSEGDYKMDKEKLKKKINSKIFFGGIDKTFHSFIETNPSTISAIFFDLDYYTSTKSFLNQIPKNKDFFSPRVYCYFDDVFTTHHHSNEHNGELLAIKEFNNENNEIKIGKSLADLNDFRFPLGNNRFFMLHNFTHRDYLKNLDYKKHKSSLSLDDYKVTSLLD
jgi:hypothetical protein